MQVHALPKGFAGLIYMNLSREAAKAQDCSAVGADAPKHTV